MIDPFLPIIAKCGRAKYPAELVELYEGQADVHDGRATFVAQINKQHRIRIGGEYFAKGQCWNFFLDDGKWNGPADIHILNVGG